MSKIASAYKYTGTEDAYQCPDCDGWHVSDYAISQLPWYIRLGIKLKIVRI